jgi:hypothetical protein
MGPVENSFNYKPSFGGFWTSTFIDLEHGSDWFQWGCREDYLPRDIPLKSWLLTPKTDLRIFVIDSYEDLVKLMSEFETDTSEIWGFKIDLPTMKSVNYEKFSEKYDVLHLTKKGEKETSSLFVTEFINGSLKFNKREYTLNGFDCECSYFTRWCFDKVEFIGEQKFKRLVYSTI